MLLGYVAITSPYLQSDQWALKAALLTLSGCQVALVRTGGGTEIWRKKTELREVGTELSAADVKRKGRKKP